MKILADQIFATLGLPWDSKLANLVLDEDRMIVETIPEYLSRIDLNSRYLGLSPTILFPAGTYEINDFLTQCKNGPIYRRQYIFDTTIEDIGLIEWLLEGTQGIQGIAGGEQGPQGIVGSQGGLGEALQGTQGTQGDLGVQGRMGTVGLQGIQGLRGSQGLIGYGVQGAVGDVTEVQGIQGNIGIQGHVGTVGLQGIQGLRGSQGTSIQGTQGLLGIQGFRGLQGIQGAAAGGTFVQSVNAYDDPTFPISYLTYTKDGIQYPITEVPKPDGLVSGGYVSWIEGLTFSTTLAAYYISGTFYTANSTQVILDAADPAHSRIDVIAVDDTGQVLVLKGIPSANPQKPSIDPETQIELTQILIPAGATVPAVDEEFIYDENVEWVGSVSGTTGNFAYTVAPFNKIYCTNITTISNKDTVTYTKTGTINTAIYGELVLFIKLKATMSNQHNLYVGFLNGGTLVSTEIVLPLLDKANITTWQNIVIPLSSFTFSSTIVNALRFRWRKQGANTNHTGFYLDFIKFQEGVVQPGISGAQGTQGSIGTQGSLGPQGGLGNQGTIGQSIQGSIGSQGNIGIQGNGGTQGEVGEAIQGDTGTQGDLGAQGIAGEGIQGEVGSQGTIGTSIQGEIGTQGDLGTQGEIGSQGNIGSQGELGSQGSIGDTGAQGLVGSQGTDGAQGTIGSQGEVGSQGTIGESIQGDLGSQGIQGVQGAIGAAQYEDISFDFNDVEADLVQTYFLDVNASFAYIIVSATFQSDSTMDDVEVQINDVPVTWAGSVTNIDVTTSVVETAAVGTNSVAVGNIVKLVTSGADGTPTLIRGKLKIQRN